MFTGGKKFAAIAAVLVATLAVARQAAAGTEPMVITLDSLLDGGENEGGITIGDKRYSDFTFSSSASGGAVRVEADDVEVMFGMDGATHNVLFFFDLNASGGQRADMVIQYRLDVLNPSSSVRRVGLEFDGGPMGKGDGRSAASITETVSTLDGTQIAQLTVFNDGENGLPDNWDDAEDILPQQGLLFAKDILVSARAGGASVGIGAVQQTVEQAVIPLPAAFWAAIPVMGLIVGKKVRRLFPTRN